MVNGMTWYRGTMPLTTLFDGVFIKIDCSSICQKERVLLTVVAELRSYLSFVHGTPLPWQLRQRRLPALELPHRQFGPRLRQW